MKQKLVDYEGAKELFSEKTGKLTSMILEEKRIHQEEVDLLKERINSILDTSQLDVPPLMGSEDQLILRKL
jgi:hypothetical protein